MKRIRVIFRGAARHPILRDFIKADAEYTAALYRRQIYEAGVEEFREKQSDIVKLVEKVSKKAANTLRQGLPKAFRAYAASIISTIVGEIGDDVIVQYTIDFSKIANDVRDMLPSTVVKMTHAPERIREMESELASEIIDAIHSDYLGGDTDVEALYGVKVEIQKLR